MDFRYSPPKQRPKTRYSISYMWKNLNTKDKIPIKTIYVGNLSSETTEKEVKEYFLQFGSVASVAIKRTGSQRGPWIYAFVTFEKSESASKALALGKHEILSRRVVVKAADIWNQPKEKDSECKTYEVSIDETSEMEFRLLRLNDDCLYHIASYLKLRDFFHLSKTCKLLECRFELIFASYKKLDTESLRGLTLEQIHEILYKIGPHLQHIVFSEDFERNGKRLEKLLIQYCVAENIVSLEFSRVYFLSKRLIQTFKYLKTLTCRYITDDMSAVLYNCKNLQNLELYGSPFLTGKHLDKLSNLQNLDLLGCTKLQPEFFKNLCMKTKLVSLNILGCRLLDSSAIETLASTQTKLETLSISNDYKTSNLSPLATLKNLKRLRIDCSDKSCDEFFQELAKHRGAELEVLEIWNCSFNHEVEKAIYLLKKLKALIVINCRNFTSMFLTKLALTSLECLLVQPLESTLDEGVLNLISKSETIKVIAGDTDCLEGKGPLVLRAQDIIIKERKYPLSWFTSDPCMYNRTFHEEPQLEPRRDFLNIIKKLGYLGSFPECIRYYSSSLWNWSIWIIWN